LTPDGYRSTSARAASERFSYSSLKDSELDLLIGQDPHKADVHILREGVRAF
jgi:hypothetical protein